MTEAIFPLSPRGAIRHWLVAAPKETPYAGPAGPEHVLRAEALDDALIRPPARAELGAAAPDGLNWRYHDPGRNEFVEFSAFFQEITVVEYYAFTEIERPAVGRPDEAVSATFWAAGVADFWLDDQPVARLRVTRYRNPDFQRVALCLPPGRHRLGVRLRALGIRDTRLLFGIFLTGANLPVVRMARAGQIAGAADWIDGVRPVLGGLRSARPAPVPAKVKLPRGNPLEWPAGAPDFSLGEAKPAALSVETTVDGVTLTRALELPGNRGLPEACEKDHRTAHLEAVAKIGLGGERPANWNAAILPLLARRALGQTTENDPLNFRQALALVEARRDCADFSLAGLLRLELLGLSTGEEKAEIRRAALAFRYWSDEPGRDAMCFHSENHRLLFHGCQMLAGLLYPDATFSNSGKTGREQVEVALARVAEWLEVIERRGFEEFNSATYLPITVGAMLNIVDFSPDPGLSRRMARQIDRIFADLAQHAFAGGVISPQGRIYRDVLFPEEAGTQVLLAYATDAALPRERGGDWVVFLATSRKYAPPADLSASVTAPVSRSYRHGDVQIVLEKTSAYLLTSLAVPAIPREGGQPAVDLRPGGAGYQQHLWQCTLGRGCHIFVNHPGGFFDGTLSRPGYWYGNGVLPRVRQEGNWLQAIHVLPDGTHTKPAITREVWEWAGPSTVRPYALHPIDFTHLHWPADAFDRVLCLGNWLFGGRDHGLVGVWCSEPLRPHDDILTGRELRAHGHSSAWLVICGDLRGEGSFEGFAEKCQARDPRFDRANFTLSMAGATPTRWWERSEPAPE